MLGFDLLNGEGVVVDVDLVVQHLTLPMLVGAVITLPVGAWVLKYADPLTLRWILALVVLSMLALLVTGWRYKGQPTPPVSFGLGLVAGVSGGARMD